MCFCNLFLGTDEAEEFCLMIINIYLLQYNYNNLYFIGNKYLYLLNAYKGIIFYCFLNV